LHTYSGEVVLFVGDTQHGPHGGFLKLREIASARCISCVVFVNNPQHAHWFAQHPSDFERFFFLPVGMANSRSEGLVECEHSVNSFIYVGNVLPPHRYRAYVLDYCKRTGINLALCKTQNYRQANSLHRQAGASLNVSLNSDLSFRISEILVSDGVCVSDKLGYVQELNFAPFMSERLVLFTDIEELREIVHDLGSLRRRVVGGERYCDIHNLNGDADIWRLARLIQEPRSELRSVEWCDLSAGHISKYLIVRDECITNVNPTLTLTINDNSDRLFFVSCLDLPRLRIRLRVANQVLRDRLEGDVQQMDAHARVKFLCC